MKNKLPFVVITILFFGTLFFLACSKAGEGTGVVPTYKDSATSTGANPNISTAGSQTST
jgi:hypothetical protein